jgi:hypothetical protein
MLGADASIALTGGAVGSQTGAFAVGLGAADT